MQTSTKMPTKTEKLIRQNRKSVQQLLSTENVNSIVTSTFNKQCHSNTFKSNDYSMMCSNGQKSDYEPVYVDIMHLESRMEQWNTCNLTNLKTFSEQ